jgi:nucleotide-binding universal stress UspA family protein
MTGSAAALLCAVQAADRSLPAIRAARWLAVELGARVHVVHVFDPMGIGVPSIGELSGLGLSTEDVLSGALIRANGELGEAARMLEDVGPEATMLEGGVVPELLRFASARGVSLLLTATTARGRVDRVLVGSVAAELAAAAPCPVLVVPEKAVIGAPGPLLCGYDGSDHSLRAARHAARLATLLRRDLLLAHVRGDRDAERLATRELDDAAAAVAASASGAGRLLDIQVTTCEGDPGEELSRLARAHDVAAVAAGNRGRGLLAAMLLGSVSTGLVRSGARPVMLVPATADS